MAFEGPPTRASNSVLNLTDPPIDKIIIVPANPLSPPGDPYLSGINMNESPLYNLPAPVLAGDAARLGDVTAASLPAGAGPIPWAGDEGSVPAGWLLCDGEEYDPLVYPDLFASIGITYNTGGETPGWFRIPDLRGRVPVGRDDMGGSAAGRITGATTEGDSGGSQTHTLAMAEMPLHSHAGSTTGNAGGHTHTGSTANAGSHSHGGSVSGGGTHTHQTVASSSHGHHVPRSFTENDMTPGPFKVSGENHTHETQGPNSTTAISGGSHSHSLSVNSAGNHGHTMNLNPISDHSHSVNISSDGSGTAHNNLQPYIVFNYIIKA